MKIKNLLLATTITFVAFIFLSCKKDSLTTNDETEATFELSSNEAIIENITEDANDILFQVTTSSNLNGSGRATNQQRDLLNCGSVNINPLSGFPKIITIDFGSGCTIGNITRKGLISITISDSVRLSGSTAVMTFDGYYVNSYKLEGAITWTNTSVPGTKSWQRKSENGKITAPDSKYWQFSGVKDIVQTAGSNTPHNLIDDVFSITGNHTIINVAKETRTSTILEPLQKKFVCENVDRGTAKIEGENHTAVIDFGQGDCDKIATVSIDGGVPRTIILR
jgi:hypothetical protein